MSTDQSFPDITAHDINAHLNQLLFFIMAENRELKDLLAHRDRKIELLLSANRHQPEWLAP
jgi:hypothetical protein